mgnify:CR=1 FL=1
MKKLLMLIVLPMFGCAAYTPPTVDAAPVLQGSMQPKTAFGASVTGRNWNAPPSDAPGGSAGRDGVGNL